MGELQALSQDKVIHILRFMDELSPHHSPQRLPVSPQLIPL